MKFGVSDPHFFFADPDPDLGKNLHADPDPGKNLHADPDPDPNIERCKGIFMENFPCHLKRSALDKSDFGILMRGCLFF